MSQYYYSAKFLNRKFGCNLQKDFDKESICQEIENQRGNETNFVTITSVDEESQMIHVDYSYWEFGECNEESCTLSFDDCY